MFKRIIRLLFGGEEQTHVEVKSGDVVEEEWFVVSHQEAVSEENQSAELIDSQPSNSAPHADTVANMEADIGVSDLDSTDPSRNTTSRAITGSISPIKALVEVTQSTCIQRAKTWADRHHMTRNAIQRQNRVPHGVQHNFFHLQQPRHHKLNH